MGAPLWVGPLVLVAVAAAWVAVQRAWRKTFPAGCADGDTLAGRMGCHGCSREETCDARDVADRKAKEQP